MEKAINFFVYNLPLLIVIVLGMWGGTKLLSFAFFGTLDLQSGMALLGSKAQPVTTAASKNASIYALLGYKYLFFIFEFFWISFIFTFYSKQKRTSYSSSLFKSS